MRKRRKFFSAARGSAAIFCTVLLLLTAGLSGAAAQGVPSPEEVTEWQMAADAGDADAQTALGMMRLSGQGVPQDIEKGIAYLTTAAEAGHTHAQYMLGLVYGTDLFGAEPDSAEARKWLQAASDQGYRKAAQMLEALDSGAIQTSSETIEELKQRAESGDAEAQYLLGSRHRNGFGVAADNEKAFRLLHASAQQGHALAQSDLGIMLSNIGEDKKAAHWTEKAAKQGVVNSQYFLARLYADGRGVERDLEKTLFWLTQAAQQGDPRAMENLRELLE